MAFQDIKPIDDYQSILDFALSRASKWSGKKLKGKSDFEKAKTRESTRFLIARDALVDKLEAITKSFPSIDNFSEFYQELTKTNLKIDDLKKSLGAVNRSKMTIKALAREYKDKVYHARSVERIDHTKKAYIGRISSVMTRLEPDFKILRNAREVFRRFPTIKTELFTVCIAGFPNAGKTTLLTKLTTSKAEINSYAFTTKNLNLGYAMMRDIKVQFIDTPGSLAREDKMNAVEKQAHLALKYQADVIVYVFDLIENYPLEMQINLLNNLKKLRKDIIIYLSKTDILEKEKVDDFKKKYDIVVNIKDLKEEITKLVK